MSASDFSAVGLLKSVDGYLERAIGPLAAKVVAQQKTIDELQAKVADLEAGIAAIRTISGIARGFVDDGR